MPPTQVLQNPSTPSIFNLRGVKQPLIFPNTELVEDGESQITYKQMKELIKLYNTKLKDMIVLQLKMQALEKCPKAELVKDGESVILEGITGEDDSASQFKQALNFWEQQKRLITPKMIVQPLKMQGLEKCPNADLVENGESQITYKQKQELKKLYNSMLKDVKTLMLKMQMIRMFLQAVEDGENQIQEDKPLKDDSASPPELILNSYNGEQKLITLSNTKLEDMTVLQLKEQVVKTFPNTGLVGDVSLIYKGMPLDKDSARLSDCNIKHLSLIQVVKKVSGG